MEPSSCPKREDYRGVMIDIALEDTSLDEPALVDQLRRHIRVCPHCQREFNAYRRVVTLFTPPPVSDEEIEEIAASVRRRVLAKVHAYGRRCRLAKRVGAIVVVLAAASVAVVLWSSTGGRPATEQRGVTSARVVAAGEGIGTGERPNSAAREAQSSTLPAAQVKEQAGDTVLALKERRKAARASLPPETPEGRRVQALGRLENTLWTTVGAMRKEPKKQLLDEARQAARELRVIAESVPTTAEGKRACYLAFRFLQLLGETGEAEGEFDAYVAGVRREEGVEAARKVLAEESVREKCAGNYELAYRRQQALLAFTPAGEAAAAAYIEMGHILTRAGRLREAETTFRRGIELRAPAPVARQACLSLINAEIGRGDYPQALRDAQALQDLPGSEADKVNDQVALAMVIERMQGPVKALVAYRQILAKHPANLCAAAKWRLKEIESRIERGILSDPLEGRSR